MSKRTVKIALVQMSCAGPAEENLDKALRGIRESARLGADLVVLPELFLGPYFCQRKDDRTAFQRAEALDGPTSTALSAAAREARVTLVGGSIFERDAASRKFYNTSCVFGPDGSVLGHYRKTHIPEDILYHEQHYFSPGDTGVRVFDTPAGKVAPLICYDQWYPEVARIAALQGAQILVYPTAIGLIDEQVEQNITGDWEGMWRAAQVGHAAANNVYVAAVNRGGREGAITFWGGSFVAGPAGDVLAKGGSAEEVVLAECDLSRVKALQDAWRFLPNRRPDAYAPLALRGKADLAKAVELAAHCHAEQQDKQGGPYILHPLRVMLRVLGRVKDGVLTGREAEIAPIVAVLHDTVEDTGLTPEQLRAAGFAEDVLAGLDLVTHRWEDSYADYVVKMTKAPLARVAREVKLADLEDNSRRDRALLRLDRVEGDLRREHRYLLTYKFLQGELSEPQYRELMARHG